MHEKGGALDKQCLVPRHQRSGMQPHNQEQTNRQVLWNSWDFVKQLNIYFACNLL